MALLFLDGFDARDASTKWTYTFSGPDYSNGRFTGSSMRMSYSTCVRSITPSATVTVGMALYVFDAMGDGISFYSDTATTKHLNINWNSTNTFIQVWRNGTLLATGTKPLPMSTWHYIEIQATIADAGGTCVVRLDGDTTPDINFTGDTRNGGTSTNIDAVRLSAGAGNYFYADDLYILNSTGTTNNTFLGDIRVNTLTPSGNGNYSQLVGSDLDSVDNYLLVDELPYSSADYVGSAIAGQHDTYVMSDLPASTTAVFGLQANMIAAKRDASAASAKAMLRTNSTDYFGTTYSLGTSYQNYRDIFEINPDTLVDWSVSDVNNLESGMEVA